MRVGNSNQLIVDRLNRHVRSVLTRYPDAAKQAEDMRAKRGTTLPDWPQWCYLPMAGAYAIVTGGRNDVHPTGSDVGVVAAILAWRVSKGIYDFDPTVLDALWDTPITGELPVEVLERLPEWCCYIPFPVPRRVLGDGSQDCVGFFVHLERDQNSPRTELRFVLDFGEQLTAIPLHVAGTVEQSVNAALDEALAQFRKRTDGRNAAQVEAAIATLRKLYVTDLPPLISLVLYLCSTAAEMEPRGGKRPAMQHAKRGTKLFAAQAPTVWEVGYRIGRAIRAGLEAEHQAADAVASESSEPGTHARPRPHIRRAHYHSFWMGPKTGARQLVLKWLPPIAVAVDADGEAVPTIHRVGLS